MLKRRYKPKPKTDLPEFFQKHVEIIKTTRAKCMECGCELKGTFDEVAHILPKQYFKSIATEDSNVFYLCAMYSENNCHGKYDNSSNEDIKKMKIFEDASKRFEDLQELITEKLNYKHYDRWQV